MTNTNRLNRDFYDYLGWIFFAFFIILSFIFYKECVIYQDNASEMTFVISGRINPVPFRWGVIPFRIFAVIGPYIGLSLKAIILLSSFWFIFLKFIGWLLCQYYFKNRIAGLLIIFSIILSMEQAFYAHALQMFEASLYFCILFCILLDDEVNKKGHIWMKTFVVIALMVLIKGTHIMTFLMIPILLFYYSYQSMNVLKGMSIAAFLIISALYLTVFKHPYEGQHMDTIQNAILTFSFSDYHGLYLYILKEFISLNFLFPFIAFILLNIFLIKEKKHLMLLVTNVYLAGMFLLIFFKLAGAAKFYPLSNDYTFYLQAAFYTLFFTIVALFLYKIGISKKYRDLLDHTVFKTILVLITLIYTSRITTSGIEKAEYNYYLKSLMLQLSKDYKEKIFIIHPNQLPFRFSKININAEYETLIKSNIMLGQSLSLYITPYTEPITFEGQYPTFLNGVYQVDKIDVSKLTYNHYRRMFPKEYFEELSDEYFKFDNLEHTILSKEYMDAFNKQYGFSVNEY